MQATETDLFKQTADKDLAEAEATLVAAVETIRSARQALEGADAKSPVTGDEVKAAGKARRMANLADKAAADALACCVG